MTLAKKKKNKKKHCLISQIRVGKRVIRDCAIIMKKGAGGGMKRMLTDQTQFPLLVMVLCRDPQSFALTSISFKDFLFL